MAEGIIQTLNGHGSLKVILMSEVEQELRREFSQTIYNSLQIDEILALVQELKLNENIPILIETLMELGNLNLFYNNNDAYEYYNEAFKYCWVYSKIDNEGRACIMAARVLILLEKFDLAADYFEKYLDLIPEMSSSVPNDPKQIRRILAQIYTIIGNFEKASEYMHDSDSLTANTVAELENNSKFKDENLIVKRPSVIVFAASSKASVNETSIPFSSSFESLTGEDPKLENTISEIYVSKEELFDKVVESVRKIKRMSFCDPGREQIYDDILHLCNHLRFNKLAIVCGKNYKIYCQKNGRDNIRKIDEIISYHRNISKMRLVPDRKELPSLPMQDKFSEIRRSGIYGVLWSMKTLIGIKELSGMKINKSIQTHQICLSTAQQKLKNDIAVAESLKFLGFCHLQVKNYYQAIIYFENIYDIGKNINDLHLQIIGIFFLQYAAKKKLDNSKEMDATDTRLYRMKHEHFLKQRFALSHIQCVNTESYEERHEEYRKILWYHDCIIAYTDFFDRAVQANAVNLAQFFGTVLGNAHYQLGDIENALKYYSFSNSHDSQTVHNCYRINHYLGNSLKAKEYLTELSRLELFQTNNLFTFNVYRCLADLSVIEDKYEEAYSYALNGLNYAKMTNDSDIILYQEYHVKELDLMKHFI